METNSPKAHRDDSMAFRQGSGTIGYQSLTNTLRTSVFKPEAYLVGFNMMMFSLDGLAWRV